MVKIIPALNNILKFFLLHAELFWIYFKSKNITYVITVTWDRGNADFFNKNFSIILQLHQFRPWLLFYAFSRSLYLKTFSLIHKSSQIRSFEMFLFFFFSYLWLGSSCWCPSLNICAYTHVLQTGVYLGYDRVELGLVLNKFDLQNSHKLLVFSVTSLKTPMSPQH